MLEGGVMVYLRWIHMLWLVGENGGVVCVVHMCSRRVEMVFMGGGYLLWGEVVGEVSGVSYRVVMCLCGFMV